MSYRIHLGPHPTAARCARLTLARNLADWGLSALYDNAALVTTELVTNAARLNTPFTLALTPEPGAVLIEVTDNSPALPQLKKPPTDAEDGRGLILVSAIAAAWGTHPHKNGKTVWARITK